MEQSGVVIKDVLLRDGLQNLDEFIPTDVKLTLFKMILASGVTHIQFTSFVNPKAVPQFQDASRLAQAVVPITPEGVELSALVPNLKGAQLALEAGVRHLEFVMSASESHNINNVRRTIGESIEELERILEWKAKYPGTGLTAGLATVFGCPFEGAVNPGGVLHLIHRFHSLGVRSVGIADTVGFGNPKEVAEVSRRCVSDFPDVTFSIHLHNTRGLGLANAYAAHESGIQIFDGAIGGLGGCPFAPGASGNTATEDLVFMFEEMGIGTGVELDKLLDVARYLHTVKRDLRFSGSLLSAGLPKRLGVITKEQMEQRR